MVFVDFEPAIMPYNTRRKSLSLPSLGIQLPVTQASRAAARSSPPSNAPATAMEHPPPNKRAKRSHHATNLPAMSPPPKPTSILDNTPPPSPAPEGDDSDDATSAKDIDLSSIKDDIVEAVVVQLQKTGNRPHLVKELATIFTQTVKTVEQSANPAAIISSRLATFLKRPWTAQAPCPLAKELETVHPRRTYYYLTCMPRGAMPDHSSAFVPSRAIISPSTSSAASTTSDEKENSEDTHRRRQLSPSPEIDLSGPEYSSGIIIAPSSPADSFSRHSEPRESRSQTQSQRANSPPLEKDEKEFTQTAWGMQKRVNIRRGTTEGDVTMGGVPSDDGTMYSSAKPETETLFGEGDAGRSSLHVLNPSNPNAPITTLGATFPSSPAIKPNLNVNVTSAKRPFDDGDSEVWSSIDSAGGAPIVWDLRSPEVVALDELDAIFDGF